MEVNLAAKELKPHSSSMLDAQIENITKENDNSVKKEENKNNVFTDEEDESGLLLASLPKAEVKIKKLDESKLLMDNNENSLSVDTLIEILSSNDTNPTTIDNIKSDLMTIDDVPPPSNPSTLDSPSPSSSSTKTGFSSPTPPTATETSSYTPSPKSSSTSHKKFPSPHHPNGGKPMIADLNKKMKQISRRQPKPKAVYQSQISDNSVGIKLCIKKSINTIKTMPSPSNSSSSNSNSNKSPRKRSRKSNKGTTKGEGESDSDDPYVKRRKKSSTATSNNHHGNKASFEEPVEQSVWGKDLPKEILFDVS